MMNKTKIKRYMKHYPDLLLLFALLSVTTMIKAQISIRPYSEWEATQFVAVNGHQPEDYVKPDNNWEILYNIRFLVYDVLQNSARRKIEYNGKI